MRHIWGQRFSCQAIGTARRRQVWHNDAPIGTCTGSHAAGTARDWGPRCTRYITMRRIWGQRLSRQAIGTARRRQVWHNDASIGTCTGSRAAMFVK